MKPLTAEKRRQLDTLLEQYRGAILDEEKARGVLPDERKLLERLQ